MLHTVTATGSSGNFKMLRVSDPRGNRVWTASRAVMVQLALALALVLTCAPLHHAQGQASPAPVEPPSEPTTATSVQPRSPSLSTGQTPTDTLEELRDAGTRRDGTIRLRERERLLERLSIESQSLESRTGLRLGFAYTMLAQQATGGPGKRAGAAGDLDLLAKWTLLGRGTKNTGELVFAAEYRFQIGTATPSQLGGELGTLMGTTNGFSERPMIVKEAYWLQRLFEDHLRVGIGRVDPENVTGGHRLQSANTAFLNKAFSGNPAIAFPGNGAAAGVSFRPTEQFYATVGAANAYGRSTTMEVDELFSEWKLFSFVELGFTPQIDGFGAGRYRVSLWNIDEREETGQPQDSGFSIILEQDFGPRLQAFARYGHADGDVTGITNLIEGGLAVKGLIGSKDNLTGLALAWAEPTSDDDRAETVLEMFQRWQVTAQTQFTLGIETIFNPGKAPDDDVIGVFSARLRVSF